MFHVSPRNSATAVSHLLSTVGVQHLLVSGEPSLQAVAREALGNIGKDWSSFVSDMPSYPDLLNERPVKMLSHKKFAMDSKLCYLHSSGKSACSSGQRSRSYPLPP